MGTAVPRKGVRQPSAESRRGKYGKSEAQILVRWCIQHDTLPLPKTATLSRIPENADVFDFEISTEDMAALDAVKSVGRLGPHPDRGKY